MMVSCPVCKTHVNYVYLRSASPTCENGHVLGRWVRCGNSSEEHVYLFADGGKCPYCGNDVHSAMQEGLKVRCLFVNDQGLECSTRPYVWMKEGPPCFMNHIEKMKVER